MKKFIVLFSVVALLAVKASAQTTISAKDAAKHLNEKVTVCDKIWSTKFFDNSNMTLMDVGGYHPNELLTVVIKPEDRKKFTGKPEEDYKGKEVCITGTIINFKGKPEIVLTEPDQIKLSK